MTDGTCCSALGWCAQADALFNLPGFHVLEVVHEDPGRVVVSIETDADIGGARPVGSSRSVTGGGFIPWQTPRVSG